VTNTFYSKNSKKHLKKNRFLKKQFFFKPNNLTSSYSGESDIRISLLVYNGIHIGKPKLFSYKKLNKFIIGKFLNYEVMNLIWSRRLLVYQISYIIKYAVRIRSWKTTSFAIASVDNQLKYDLKSWGHLHNIDCFGGNWIPGTFSAKLCITKPSYFVIIPDCTKSSKIVIEANISAIPIIGLVGSNNIHIDRITYPVFGNEDNRGTANFFCKLCAALILKEQQKSTFTSSILKESLFRYNNYILRIKKLQWKQRRFRKSRSWIKKRSLPHWESKNAEWINEFSQYKRYMDLYIKIFLLRPSIFFFNKYKKVWEKRKFTKKQGIKMQRLNIYWNKKFRKIFINKKSLKKNLSTLNFTLRRLCWSDCYYRTRHKRIAIKIYKNIFKSKIFFYLIEVNV